MGNATNSNIQGAFIVSEKSFTNICYGTSENNVANFRKCFYENLINCVNVAHLKTKFCGSECLTSA